MPVIPEYTSKGDSLTLPQGGVSALAQAAQHTTQAGYRIKQFKDETGRLMQQGFDFGASADRSAAGQAREVGALAAQGGRLQAEGLRDVGQGISDLGKPAQELIGKVQEQQETSNLHKAGNQVFLNASTSFNQAMGAADINDQDAYQKWHDQVLAPSLQKLRDSAVTPAGRAMAESMANDYEKHFQQVGIASNMSRAGLAFQSNLDSSLNSATAAVRSDPSSLDLMLKRWGSDLDATIGTHPLVSAAEAAKAKTTYVDKGRREITVSALDQMAKNNPDAFDKHWNDGTFDRYKQFLSPEEQKQLGDAARLYRDRARADDTHNLAEEQRQAKMASDRAANGYISSLHDDQGNFTVPKDINKRIRDDQNLLPQEKVSLWRTMDRLAKHGELEDQDGLVSKLIKRAQLPDDDPNKLRDPSEVWAHVSSPDAPLSIKSAEFIVGKTMGAEAKEGGKLLAGTVKEWTSRMNPLGSTDAGGLHKVNQFEQWFYPAYEEALKTMSPAQALDENSPLMKQAEKKFGAGAPLSPLDDVRSNTPNPPPKGTHTKPLKGWFGLGD